jgi:hypothetical protein
MLARIHGVSELANAGQDYNKNAHCLRTMLRFVFA